MKDTPELQNLAINTIRFLSADGVQQANSGPSRPADGRRANGLYHLDPRTCAITRPTQSGLTATASSFPAGMARCCSIACCT